MSATPLLTPEAAREWFGGISKNTLDKYVSEGLPVIRLGKARKLRRFRLADLEAFASPDAACPPALARRDDEARKRATRRSA